MNIVSPGWFSVVRLDGDDRSGKSFSTSTMMRFLDILREYDVTISLGDALRPGCLDDTDAGQIAERLSWGALAQRAWDHEIQVMIEGPGHMAMDELPPTCAWKRGFAMRLRSMFWAVGDRYFPRVMNSYHLSHRRRHRRGNGADFLCLRHPGRTSSSARCR